MKILLDECVPCKLKTRFPGHECRTASEAGFAGKKNGELLRLAESADYDVLLTVDRGIEHQLNMRERRISVLILRSKSSRLRDLIPLVPDCLETLSALRPGEIVKLPRRP
jgi:predicted nuclease of predicted toxin-antitoxin system